MRSYRKSTTDAERFWKHVDIRGKDECWNWTGCLMHDGYGRFGSARLRKDKIRTHRFAFFLTHGRWPTPCALHRCDNPKCVNPNHLFEGTVADNMRDCIAKGRYRNGSAKGEENGNVKLTKKQVIELRSRRASGESAKNLAKDYAISQCHVQRIVNRKSWTQLTDVYVKL